jgi:5-bromo-4-chloroindolyl phosphate hydrolysis protein
MSTFCVEVCRIGYASYIFEIKAKTYKQAEQEALDIAGSHSFSEHDADYVLADAPTKEDKLREKLSQTQAQLDMVLKTLKEDLPLLLGKDKNLDKRITKILKKG